MNASSAPLGVHLVGSICGASSASQAFQKCITSFPHRLRRLPDGEAAHRSTFVGWQTNIFKATPAALCKYDEQWNIIPEPPPSEVEVQEIVEGMPPIKPGYDDYALESYAEFKRLKGDGTIPKGVKFQVCLPSVFCVMGLLRPSFKAAIEPLYTDALLNCLRRIEAEIPHDELAVQVDIAGEPSMLEVGPGTKIWNFELYWEGDRYTGIVDRIAMFVGSVSKDVDVGLHICYGDQGHKHFVEPKDTSLIVMLANGISEKVDRPINWIHLPVPKDRYDEEYFEPLRELDFGIEQELYLGLVHAKDKEGTEKRLKTAQKVLRGRAFGISTECGLGRTAVDDFDSIAEISTFLSSPVE